MDLSTTYLGLRLSHPLMAGASPLGGDLDGVRRLEDAGAAAVVLPSLFEEQIRREQLRGFLAADARAAERLDALSYAPRPESFALRPEEYLAHLARVKAAVGIPVLGSLNGITLGGWLEYARAMEQAGADALELNVYAVPSDLDTSGKSIEDRTIDMLRAVRAYVRLPLAVKLSSFYTSPAHFMKRLSDAGADGLVLFNRFYQPDFDHEELQPGAQLTLSTPDDLPLRLHWLALVAGRLRSSLAASGGIADADGAAKAILCGADAVQVVSALIREGPRQLTRMREGLVRWMEEHGHASIRDMRGRMSLELCPDPGGYERSLYMSLIGRLPRVAP